MPETSNYDLPYPGPGDPPDGPGGIYNLAVAVDGLLAQLADRYCEVRLDAALALPNNTWVDVPYDVEIHDPHGMASGADFTAPWGGRYSVAATQGIGNENMPAGTRLLAEFFSGGLAPAGGVIGTTAPMVDVAFLYYREFSANAGQGFRMHVRQDSAQDRNISNDASVTPHLIFRFLG